MKRKSVKTVKAWGVMRGGDVVYLRLDELSANEYLAAAKKEHLAAAANLLSPECSIQEGTWTPKRRKPKKRGKGSKA